MWSNDQKETVKWWSYGQAIIASAWPCDQEEMVFVHMENGGKSCWQLGGWIAGSRWGSLGRGWRVVAAWAGLSFALWLPCRTQQLGLVPLTLSSWTETFEEKIHPVLQSNSIMRAVQCTISSLQHLQCRFYIDVNALFKTSPLESFNMMIGKLTSVGPHRWYPWSFCSQTIMVPWIDLTETSAFGKVCWNPWR